MLKTLVLELYSEEIPARMQVGAAEQLRLRTLKAFSDCTLKHGKCGTYVTPRRLVLWVEGIEELQPSRTVTTKGPKVSAPASALDGFLRKSGAPSLEACTIHEGAYLFTREEAGGPVPLLLTALLEEVVRRFTWPKSMRWDDSGLRWVRPLRRVLCLYGNEILPVRVGALQAGAITVGHRVYTAAPVAVASPEAYRTYLAEHRVVLDADERRQSIAAQAYAACTQRGVLWHEDPSLLDEVTGLAEWPVVYMGAIPERFLALPEAVLTTVLRVHQKYFVTRTPQGALAPYMLFVSPMEPSDGGAAIIQGNERVLCARLEDALFFEAQDRQHGFEVWLPKLAHMTFHKALGSYAHKTQRLVELTQQLAKRLGWATPEVQAIVHAARWAKADLVSGMVGEFPELQGTMGGHYALHAGASPEVAQAIAQHYRPAGPCDALPETALGCLLALADKADSLVGLFMAGEVPTGSRDPYAMRRALFGIVRIIKERDFSFTLNSLWRQSYAIYINSSHSVREDKDWQVKLNNFCKDRIHAEFL